MENIAENQAVRVNKTDNPNYFREYYITNVVRFKEYEQKRKEIKVECPACKCIVVKKHILKHNATKKHLKNSRNIYKDLEEEVNAILKGDSE